MTAGALPRIGPREGTATPAPANAAARRDRPGTLHPGEPGASDGENADQCRRLPARSERRGARSGRSGCRARSHRRQPVGFYCGDPNEGLDVYRTARSRTAIARRPGGTTPRPIARAADSAFCSARLGTDGRRCGHRAARNTKRRTPTRTSSGKPYQTGTSEASIGSSVQGTRRGGVAGLIARSCAIGWNEDGNVTERTLLHKPPFRQSASAGADFP